MVHTNHDIDVKMCYRQFFPLFMHSTLLCKTCCQMTWTYKTILLSWLCSMCCLHFMSLCLVCYFEYSHELYLIVLP